MTIDGIEYDHIEIYDETGKLIVCISDDEIIAQNNFEVVLCEDEKMFQKG